MIGDIFKDIKPDDTTGKDVGFSSAFSKFGKTVLAENLPKDDDIIIRADGFAEYYAMQAIIEALKKNCIPHSYLCSPFSEDFIDVIITPNIKIYAAPMLIDSTVIYRDGRSIPSSEVKLRASTVDVSISPSHNRSDQFLGASYREALILAQAYFNEAALHHLGLEAIYSASMDFSSNDRYYSYIASKIDSLL